VIFRVLWRLFFGALRRLQDADDQRLAGRLNDFPGDRGQAVDLHDPLDLGEEALDEAEVADGDAGDGERRT
jgi:hypothetical protein